MYYQITFTLDKKIRGNFETPHTVELSSKSLLNYIAEKNCNILTYFKNRDGLYKNMPGDNAGHIIKRKDYVDFMDFTPACLSLKAVVSDKVKDIFENLHINEAEYSLKQIKIKEIEKQFFLLFVPIIRDTDFVYPKCKFVDMFNEREKTFQNRQEFYDDEEIYFPKKITLEAKYRGFDLLYPQGSDVFFSERVIDTFEKEKVSGYDIIKGGCFYSEIEFE